MKTITGQKEAELIYYGVRQAVKMKDEKSIVMDIGGGSVELVVADGKKIFWKGSYPLGGALLLEKFRPSDPIRNSEIKVIEKYMHYQLRGFLPAKPHIASRKADRLFRFI